MAAVGVRFSRMAGVHVCQPDGWSTCVSVGWQVLQGVFFPHVDGGILFLNDHFQTDES